MSISEIRARQQAEIDACYNEPHRAYHGWSHINDLREKLSSLRDVAKRPDLIDLAITYHDVIYDSAFPDADNVRSSADVFLKHEEELGQLSTDERGYVEALIMSTAGHEPREFETKDAALKAAYENDVRLFLDLDLSTFAGDIASFSHHSKNIRQEYKQYPDALFAAGRAGVLAKFEERDEIFLHPVTKAMWEDQAKANLKTSIDFLNAEAKRLRGMPGGAINWAAPALT